MNMTTKLILAGVGVGAVGVVTYTVVKNAKEKKEAEMNEIKSGIEVMTKLLDTTEDTNQLNSRIDELTEKIKELEEQVNKMSGVTDNSDNSKEETKENNEQQPETKTEDKKDNQPKPKQKPVKTEKPKNKKKETGNDKQPETKKVVDNNKELDKDLSNNLEYHEKNNVANNDTQLNEVCRKYAKSNNKKYKNKKGRRK